MLLYFEEAVCALVDAVDEMDDVDRGRPVQQGKPDIVIGQATGLPCKTNSRNPRLSI